MMDIKKVADVLSVRYYVVIDVLMKKYHLSDNDTPDWHGAIATAIVKCASHSAECTHTEKEANDKFLELIDGFILYELCFERPVSNVVRVVNRFYNSISSSSVEVFMELCRKHGGDGVIASRLFYSV